MQIGLSKAPAPALLVLVAAVVTWSLQEGTALASCESPANAIEAENCRAGNPPSEWDVSGSGDSNLQGFATDISVNRGGTVSFKVDTTGSAYRIDIYRLGYYNGLGARKIATIPNASTVKTNQPACLTDATTGLVDCGTWSVSASWDVPADAVSGIYLARLVGESGGLGDSHIVFVVREDGGTSDILFQTADTTWQAYNSYGGNSLYGGSGPGAGASGTGRAYKVSYNRPFTTRATAPEDWLFNAEYPMLRWLEANGYDVSYFTGVDADRRGDEVAKHKVFLSVGHDEYWSKQQRLNVERARDGQLPGQTTPVHLAFLSGNEVFWKTRWEPSIDASATSHRTLVCYKETHESAKIDPSPEWTGTWRDPRFSPPSDGGRPENALTGTIFTVNGPRNDSIQVPAADGRLRIWRNTPNVSTLAGGQIWASPAGILGYEWDEDLDNGFRPAGLLRLSTTTLNVGGRILDYGSTYGPGTATHSLTFHKRANGAQVFGAGAVQWSWGLDAEHDRAGTPTSPDLQQATVNLLADMGAQPATLQPGLQPGSASTDVVAPVSDIATPANGASLPVGVAVLVTGTANDGTPGVVGAVEVSVDGGLSWHPANGREAWSYSWTPTAAGTYAVLSRALDDSGNVESAGAGRSVTVTAGTTSTTTSIWADAGSPATVNDYDGQEIELGVKFRSSSAGTITAIRFYKASQDGNTHTVSLWSASGALLGSGTSTSETASGWQEVALASPVAITANTTYVASYHASPGYYVATTGYFTSAVTNGPLTALADGTDGQNGLYKYGAAGFPTQSYNKSNYWVDVVFSASSSGPDTTPPAVTATSPTNGAIDVAVGVSVTAAFSEPLAPATVSGTTVQLRDAAAQLVLASVAWNASTSSIVLQPTSPLSVSTTYTATVKGGAGGVTDVAGNPLAADVSWTFTTGTAADPQAGWYAGDMHVHRSCGGSPESVSSLYEKMSANNLAVISLLADMGNGEVQDPVTDLPRVNGQDDPASTPGRIIHWDTEWHWDPVYTQYPHLALGGHIVALGLTDAQQVWEEYTYPIFEWVRQRNGIAGFAHMQYLDDGIPSSLNCCLPLEYPVEVALGSAQFVSQDVQGSDSAVRAWYKLLNTGFRPGFAAGTDYPCGVSTLGSLLTYVRVNGPMTYRSWIEGIAAGRTVVSRNGQDEFLGLTVNGTARPGDEIRLAAPGTVGVNVQWTAERSLAGTIELVHNGEVVAVLAASAAPGVPATLNTTVSLPKSGWLAARRMDGTGHQVHTGAVFVIVNDAPIRASAADAQFFVQWMDNLLTRTADGGSWASFFPTNRDAARARYQAARDLFQQIAAEAAAAPPTVTSIAPSSGATGVSVATAVSATFSEPLATATVSGSTFTLRDDGGQTVAAAVSWNATTNTAVLQPTSALAYSTTYTVTVKGGTGGVTDVGGSPMASDYAWTFTTQASGSSGAVSIWAGGGSPATVNNYDNQPLELGVKFRTSQAGYITAIRFYKGSGDTGTHTARLWTSTGTQLATASFVNESASGWQEVALPSAVPILANVTYVASYHSTPGYYVASTNYFTSAVTNGPLTALADGTDGPNGVYKYGATGFPTQSYNASNYWVDVVFSVDAPGPDTTPPGVVSTTPANGASGVLVASPVTARFSEPLASATVTDANAFLRDSGGLLVPASVSWDAASFSVVIRPSAALAYSASYTATVKGGSGGLADIAGNALASDFSWTFTTQATPPPPPEEGPGGPILVIGYSGNPFSRYYAEILRAEGLNAFKAMDISVVDATVLAQYDTAILGEMPLSSSQATMLNGWVNGGGNLIAMRPDPRLADLLGLLPAGGTLAEGYIGVDTGHAPGFGIVGETMQFHGTADRYTLAAATPAAAVVATLYSDATTATSNLAVTLRDVGTAGGSAAAFAFDLARSVVYTRQGNPAWAGDERDGDSLGVKRSDDMFYGAKIGDPQPDWVNLDKVAIPQADEQQRLLVNLVLKMTSDRKPLPRFWYFPRGEKAVVVMAHDNHGSQNVEPRFQADETASPAGCSVQNWECIRSTAYLYTSAIPDDATARLWEDKGFEVALHVNTNCADWTRASLEGFYTTQIADFVDKFPSIAPLRTNRTHCIAWSDWATQPKVELANGIRLDTNYYFWPPDWVGNRPGFMTGSGMPMRFADLDGTMIDVYQAATHMTDESGQTYPFTINTLLDNAIGAAGYYGAFTANIHSDGLTEGQASAIVASSKARGVPVVTAKQMLTWLDGRNGSSFENIGWSGGVLTFGIAVGAGANGLQAMVPAVSTVGPLSGLTRGGAGVPFTRQVIKGVEYAVFAAAAGTHQAVYTPDTTPPAVSSVSAVVATNGTATVQWATDEPATSVVRYGTDPGNLGSTSSDPLLLTAHSLLLSGLAADTTYYYQVTSADPAGNASSSAILSFQVASVDTGPPVVTVVAPNGGERLFTGTPYAIAWTATDDVGVTAIDVAVSSNGGTSFTAVAGCTGLAGTAQTCTWATPGPITTQGRIRVTARDGAGQSGFATSAANFTIVSGTPSLTLTAPNTAVTWPINTTQAITFSHNLGTGATIVIDLSRDGGATWSNINPGFVTTNATTGSYSWTVTGPATAQARVRLTLSGNPAVASASAVDFTIADFVTVTAPNTAVNWAAGSTQAITWGHSLGTSQTVNIDLSRDGGATWSSIATSVANATATTGSHTWVVTSPATTQARVRVTASANPAVNDTSNVNFTISGGSITVTAPNTAVTWATGSTRSLTWSHNLGTSQTVNIDVSRDGGATWSPLAANVANATATTGTYSWVVSGPATTQARIRVRASSDPAVADTSNVNFTISGTVTITSPTGNWGLGSRRTITWNHTLGAGQTFNILLSTDGGTTYPTTLAAGVAGGATSGSHDWVVAGATSTRARVRVVWAANTAIRGTTSNFTIAAATVTVTAPNTNVNWAIGTTRTITWSHNLGTQEAVSIDSSLDAGATWTSVATSVANGANTTGSYAWTVPAPASTTARIRVTWAANAAVTDISNVNFRVANPFVTVTAPNTNVAWTIGSTYNVTFSHNLGTGQAVTIEVSRDGAATFAPITTFTTTSATSGSYPWTVTGPATTTARVRVTWIAAPTVTDISNVNFRIQ
jgi:hypothetical protein